MKYILIILITLIVIWPVFWMIQGSFQDHWGVFTIPSTIFPTGLHIRNYEGVLSSGYTWRWVLNSIVVVSLHAVLSLCIVAPAGMAFALYQFRGKQVIFWAFLSTIMIPANTIIIGKFIMTRTLGLSGTIWAAFIPVLFYSVGIFLFRRFVEEVPREIIDQSRVDGAGEVGILARIIMPLCKPVAGLVLLFVTLGSMSNLLWQSIVLQKIELKTLLVGMVMQMSNLALLFAQDIDPLGLRLAAGCILLVPSLLVFVFAHRIFIKELRLGALIQ